MSDAPLSLQSVSLDLKNHVPPDPVAFSMLPPESRDFLERAPEYVVFLMKELRAARKDRENLYQALEMYAKNSGDVLFDSNLKLCLQQVTQA
jgi:hypothetical protein